MKKKISKKIIIQKIAVKFWKRQKFLKKKFFLESLENFQQNLIQENSPIFPINSTTKKKKIAKNSEKKLSQLSQRCQWSIKNSPDLSRRQQQQPPSKTVKKNFRISFPFQEKKNIFCRANSFCAFFPFRCHQKG